jgi:L-alanine-DL-glutamate epimerase-like enolase superfamily enzyme
LLLDLSFDRWRMRIPFVTSQDNLTSIETLTVVLEEGGARGWGEALGVDYRGEDARTMGDQIEQLRPEIERGVDRQALARLLPPGGGRNALDCALWDLEAKAAATRIWRRLKIEPQPLTTAYTLSLAEPQGMAAEAVGRRRFPILKLKLDADDPVARLTAVRAARPEAELLVDANGSWSFELLQEIAPRLLELGVAMVEQPLPADADDDLANWSSPVTLCADESCQTRREIDHVAERYGMVNIKLDKTGGLSEALALADACRERGLELMVGNMLGSSLAMAPAFVIGQLCRFVDLDGPLLQTRDRQRAIRYEGAVMQPPPEPLWG